MPVAVLPWMKFYPRDWQSDQALRMCSLTARGLWVECMAIMHRADPYGHLLVNGQAPTDTQLAVLVGAPPDQIPELLGELATAGVFSRTRSGVIYSRRMTRDEKKARTARKNGRNGGNPKLCNERVIPPLDKGSHKAPDKAQRPEARSTETRGPPDAPIGASPPPKKPPNGTRLPEGWQPGPEDIAFAQQQGLTDDEIRDTADRFRDYWTAKAGRDAAKRDWPATWRNWVRRDLDDGRGGGGRRAINGHGRRSGGGDRPSGGRVEAVMRAARRVAGSDPGGS